MSAALLLIHIDRRNCMTNHHQTLRALFATALIAVSGSASAQAAAADGASAASSSLTAESAKASKAADRKLAHRIENAIARTRGLNATRILVKARDGHVTLSGSVTDNGQIQLAIDASQQVEGVKSVQNFLHVISGPAP
ncbi:BON domain-containing protein [Paraburkholderia sp. BL23I1N1]|uniref:BON domain-containing protein n=1 Tax=Paraburkholderia sp. BL23I1N1 TaxID=1938802 RepID=UPI000E70B6FC|nr:BON domain-containing protein [Paraburkholderia sp. BL23I1N1]